MKADLIARAIEAADELFWDYEVVGIRVQEEPFVLGPIDHCSHLWVDGDDSGVELDGICAQDVTTLKMFNDLYFGSHIAIVAGNEYEYGEDPGELIIRDAVCTHIFA